MALTETLRRVPWKTVYQGTYALRRTVFGKAPDPVDHVVVEGYDPAELERLLLDQGLVKGDYASYYYYGEDLNMVRGMYKDDEYEWYQYHVRGFTDDGGVRLRPHTELYWRVYPREHMRLTNLDVDEGVEMTERMLEDAGVSHDVVPAEQHPAYEEPVGDAPGAGTSGV